MAIKLPEGFEFKTSPPSLDINPLYFLAGESFEIKDKGWIVYTATLTRDMQSGDVSKALIGTELKGKKIMAVEMFAVPYQVAGTAIGLAVEK